MKNTLKKTQKGENNLLKCNINRVLRIDIVHLVVCNFFP